MQYSGSIYFLGQFRPAYFSATSLKDLRAKLFAHETLLYPA